MSNPFLALENEHFPSFKRREECEARKMRMEGAGSK